MDSSGPTSFVASPNQSDLWFRIRRGEVAPRCEARWSVSGDLDIDLLRRALRSVIARHEVLRTWVRAAKLRTEPMQTIGDVPEDLLDVVDLSAHGGDPTEDETARTVREDWSSRLRVNDAPVVRALALIRSTGSVELVISADTLVADRETLRVIVDEAARDHDLGPDAVELDPDVVQYADVAAWHLDLLDDPELAPERAHWNVPLQAASEDVGSAAHLEPDRDIAVPETRHTARIEADLAARVGAYASAGSTTAEAVLLAAWAATLARLAGGTVPILASQHGRTVESVRAAAGPFERSLPLVVDIWAATSFDALVHDVADQLDRGGELIDHLDPRDLGTRVADRRWAGFELLKPGSSLDLGETQWRLVEEEPAQASRTLTCVPTGAAQPGWEVVYSGGSVACVPSAEVLGAFVAALGSLVSASDRRPQECALSPAGVAGSDLAGFDLEVELLDVSEAVARTAAQTPEAEAVRCGLERLSYAQLHASADDWARRLVGQGVTPGDRVVLDLGREAAVPAIILGVLRAGAVFVPSEPTHPFERLRYVLADTEAVVLVSRRASAEDIGVPVMTPDEPAGADRDSDALVEAPVGDHPAYVLYTSGTTGRPKGVVVGKQALTNYLTWAAETYELGSGAGSLVHSSIAYDFVITALLAPLVAGGRVVLLPVTSESADLAAALRDVDVSVLKLTPTHLDLLRAADGDDRWARGLRTLVLGGEQLPAESLQALRDLPGLRIVNEYGPTETVVGSTAYVVDATTPTRGRVPIGRPIAGTVVTIRDPEGRPVPPGAYGEIWIGGAGLADGYLGDDASTRARFVVDEHGRDPGRTHYRTGDLARLLPGGDMEFLGRLDDQIKIRGVRVEPDEVGAVLREHAAVDQAAVVARPGPAGQQRLVAYVVPAACADGTTVRPADLVAHVAARLPDPAVPGVVLVEGLPMTATGKLDLEALPDPDARTAGSYVAPRDETEQVLTSVIAEVLGVDRVGIDDDYLALGGDSIRSVMIAARAASRGVALDVARLHAHPTVRWLAEDSAPAPSTTARPGPFSLVSSADRELMPADVEDAFPLSRLQEGMIFHRDFAAKSAVYHAIASVRLQAPFDSAAFETAVRSLVERHPMLRTSFDMATFSRPLQMVHATFETPLHEVDLRGIDPAEQQGHISRWVEGEQNRGFELHDYPLIRFMVHRLSEEEFQFTYGFHHEIVDGWSEALMVTELFEHYFCLVFDEPVDLPTPTASMRDAVALELEALADQHRYDFWDGYLADASLMRLPRAEVAHAADKGARAIVRLEVPIPIELSTALKGLARDEGVPLKAVLLAAHMRVMSAYGGDVDTLSYTVTNGRPEDVDGSTAIGLFVNSLAHRVSLPGGTWRELIRTSMAAELETMPHRRLPMAELKRHKGNEPLAETLFFFTDYHVFRILDRWRERGVQHVADELYGESTFPFCGIFRLSRETGDLEVRVEYDSLQFSRSLMDGICESYVAVLTAMAAQPNERYDHVEVLPEADRETLQVLRRPDFSETSERCLHDLFADLARARPDATALQWLGGTVSYGALDQRSCALAEVLRADGVGAEVPVGVLAGRSVEQVVAILAVLKAGGAYVPLDPTFPEARLSAMVAQSGAQRVIVPRTYADRVPAGAEAVVLDGSGTLLSPSPASGSRVPRASPGNAAYIMFTSGSAGLPKAVVVTHRNAVASSRARDQAYPEVDRFLLLSSFAFDSSVAGIFGTLTQGGCLVLPPEGTQLEPLDVLDQLGREGITHTLAIPSLLTPVLEQADEDELKALRVVIAAGEPCPTALLDLVEQHAPGAVLHNEYGPTEATVWSTVWSGRPTLGRPHLPIGRPIAGTSARVRNSYGHDVPVGVSGSLTVAGAGVARGYLGQPRATASAFRPDERAAEPGARAYNTGDVVRTLASGDLEFVGRGDQQVKVRGFRVEMSEIEGTIETHPEVHTCVVAACRDARGRTELAAYVVLQPGGTLDAANVQQFVRDRLPRYMVPARCEVIDSVPLTPTGKVDRAALPAPDDLRPQIEYVEPRTESERMIAALWCRVLGVDRVSTRASFFDLSGESLGAMQVTTAVNTAFGTRMTVRTLFDAATLAEFAAAVDAARAGADPRADRGV